MTATQNFNETLREQLVEIRELGLYRELRKIGSPQSVRIEFDGRSYLNFSSNDYLGLANDPVLKEASIAAIEKYGAGAGASRLICGSLGPHHELESALAEFKGTESALSFSSGYTTALGTLCALLKNEDVVVLDKRVHACLVDAAKLSGAKIRVFAHNDLDNLEEILKWADQRSKSTSTARRSRTLIVTETMFSMDGDRAPLRELVELKEKYGAWLMLDEAHATGIFGSRRTGLAEECGVSDRVEIQMGTLGKALGAAGGYICGSRSLIDALVNQARSFIFSTAPAPVIAAAARSAIQFVRSKEGEARCRKLWANVDQWLRTETGSLSSQANEKVRSDQKPSVIIPILIGDESKAVEAAGALRERGIFIPAIRYPTVGRGQARLRVTVTASHAVDDIATLREALGFVTNVKFGR